MERGGMDEDQELRFVCKLCLKKYPCGKSLGGHMRSHVVANSAESDEKPDPNFKKFPQFVVVGVNNGGGGGGGGVVEGGMNGGGGGDSRMVESSYGLRENPRKSWRAVDSSFPLPQEKVCKQCGKGFHSLKALCGHMACHSDKDRGGLKDDHSWTSENQKLVMDSHSDTEEGEDRVMRTRSSKSKRFKKVVVNSPFPLLLPTNNGSSSASEIDGEEQEEVAMCLMMLSRDSGNKGGVNSVVESSDNNSVILETKSSSIDMKNGKKGVVQCGSPQVKKGGDEVKSNAEAEDSDSGYFLDECAKAESDVSVDGFRRNNGVNEYDEYRESLIRSKRYRAEVKRELEAKENVYDDHHQGIAARIEESRKRRYLSENSDFYNEYEKKSKIAKTSNGETGEKRPKYECFNCKKTFKSYQALGGHRPCHKKSSSNNAFYESRYESGDDSTEFRGKPPHESKKAVVDKKAKSSSKKNKGHICPFCNRVFKNGQALGGHKRSHFIGGHDLNNANASAQVTKLDLLDLNLPAPHEDDDDDAANDQFSPW